MLKRTWRELLVIISITGFFIVTSSNEAGLTMEKYQNPLGP